MPFLLLISVPTLATLAGISWARALIRYIVGVTEAEDSLFPGSYSLAGNIAVQENWRLVKSACVSGVIQVLKPETHSRDRCAWKVLVRRSIDRSLDVKSGRNTEAPHEAIVFQSVLEASALRFQWLLICVISRDNRSCGKLFPSTLGVPLLSHACSMQPTILLRKASPISCGLLKSVTGAGVGHWELGQACAHFRPN